MLKTELDTMRLDIGRYPTAEEGLTLLAQAPTDAQLTAVNPMIQESGQIDLGPYKVHWRSATTTSVTDGTGYPAGISHYRVALYESEVEVAEASGSILTTVKLRQVGYRRVREPLRRYPEIPGDARPIF